MYHATDVAGNAEAEKTFTVNVDTSKPVTSALAASVVKGRTATLKYKVTETGASAGKATVVIKVKNRAGKVVKTIKAGQVAVNVTVSAKFTCTLAKGAYTYTVYATDVAGNVAVQGRLCEADRQVARAGRSLRVQRGRGGRMPAAALRLRQRSARMVVPTALIGAPKSTGVIMLSAVNHEDEGRSRHMDESLEREVNLLHAEHLPGPVRPQAHPHALRPARPADARQ